MSVDVKTQTSRKNRNCAYPEVPVAMRRIKLKCNRASYAFSGIMECEPRSLIVTSGTLPPVE